MAYTPTSWNTGDTITAAAMNKIEQGIASAGGDGGGVFIVEISYDALRDNDVLSATSKEIYDAILDGEAVTAYQVISSNTMIFQYPLCFCSKGGNIYNFYFFGVQTDTTPIEIYVLQFQGNGDNSTPTLIDS